MLTNGVESGLWFDVPDVTGSPHQVEMDSAAASVFYRLIEP